VTDYFCRHVVTWSLFDGFAKQGAAAFPGRRRQLEHSYRDLSRSRGQARDQLKLVSSPRRGNGYHRPAPDLERRGGARQEGRRGPPVSPPRTTSTPTSSAIRRRGINAFAARSDYLMKTTDFLSTLLESTGPEQTSPHPVTKRNHHRRGGAHCRSDLFSSACLSPSPAWPP